MMQRLLLTAWIGVGMALWCGAAPAQEAPDSPDSEASLAQPVESPESEAPEAIEDEGPAEAAAPREAASPREDRAARGDRGPEETRLTFNFRYQPWQDVLDWFADQSDLSLLIEAPPPGTFNYRDTRTYTAAEALDVINGVLLTKGFTLVRNGRMLVLVNLEDGIPPNLVPDVPLAELDQRGEYEIMRTLFPVWSMTPEQAAEEIKPLLGPQGSVVVLPQARAIQVTETAGRLRTVRKVINAVEQPEEASAGVREFELQYLTVAAAMPTIRQMLGIPEDAYSSPDGSLHITKSAIGEKLLVRGTAQHAARLDEVLRLIDVPEASAGIDGTPQMEVYSIASASPEAVLEVLKSVMADDPNVRLTTDPKTGYIVAFARPSQHATIRATIEQMQKEARQVDVIPLANVDPQSAVLAINKLFGSQGEEPDPTAPRVDADITTRSLLVRGTASQVEQIRGLLAKMGENEEGGGLASSRQNVRMLPLSGAAARSAISQIQEIWPSMRSNRIRVVTPTDSIRTYRPGDSVGPTGAPADSRAPDAAAESTGDSVDDLWQQFLNEDPSAAVPRDSKDESDKPTGTDRTARRERALFRFAASEVTSDEEGDALPGGAPNDLDSAAPGTLDTSVAGPQGAGTQEEGPQAAPDQSIGAVAPPGGEPQDISQTSAEAAPLDREARAERGSQNGASIIIAPGPGGTMIASDDLEALDALEEMLDIVAGRSTTGGREYAVFYLKYSKAASIAEVLSAIFGSKSGGGDGGLVGDMASAALGDLGGGLMGDLLLGGGGGSGGGFSTGAIDIVPDARLNALIVYAKPADLDTVEQLLKVLDQRAGPEEVEASARPRLIPVYNTEASEIAQVVQQVYQDRMGGASGQISPQEMMKMLRGSGPNVEAQVEPMSIGVDERSNSLVVRAPDALFEEVKLLVESLDNEQFNKVETTRVVSLKHTNSAAVQKAITSIMDNVRSSSGSTEDRGRDDRRRDDRRRGGDDDSPGDEARRNMRRQFEMMREFQQMRERMQRGQGGGDRGRGGDRRGGGGGGGGGERRGGGGPPGRG